ncbi:MAG: type II toxin-antitoxin system RelE/ParE family toxin [Deltaproteobacteria bacterium]|nr:type II toxin-antitoxin system RelE/ParE family toxin [Deltaproteobacteria bacterium]
MTYTVLFKEPAKHAVEQLDRGVRLRIFNALQRIATQPSLGKPLRTPLQGLWSYRVGDWRIVYEVQQRIITVVVIGVGHRREIYDTITRLLRPRR